MKKAIIFDPYMDTLGGGERYVLTFAVGCHQSGYQAIIAWPDDQFIHKAESRFGMDLSFIKVDSSAYNLFTQSDKLLTKLFFTRQFDLVFWVSDGSLPFLFSKKNIVHFQVPFTQVKVSSLKEKLISHYIYNSQFTQKVLEKNVSKGKGIVLYPPVDLCSFTSKDKQKQILSVGRFDSPSHSKRQDILIKAFSILYASHPEYSLVLAGGLKGDDKIVESLKQQIGNLPIKLLVNEDFESIRDQYAKSMFYWHAAGYGIDDKTDPEKVEHFGITTVEAMASGCVPIVINRGGQKEIISSGVNGYLCENEFDIATSTKQLIENMDLYSQIKSDLSSGINKFSKESFIQQVKNLIQ